MHRQCTCSFFATVLLRSASSPLLLLCGWRLGYDHGGSPDDKYIHFSSLWGWWSKDCHLTVISPTSSILWRTTLRAFPYAQLVDLCTMYYLIPNTLAKPNRNMKMCITTIVQVGPLCSLVAMEDRPRHVDEFCHKVAWPREYLLQLSQFCV